MRHNVDGRKFGRNTSHRVAMLRNMANSVIQKEQIITTVQKAKEARRVVDRLVTLGKQGTPAARRLAFDRTRDSLAVSKLFGTLADRYKTRAGGYTRILKVSDRRWGDAAEMAVLELVDRPEGDRKRKRKVAAAGEGEQAQKAASPTQDPLNRFRRMFGGGKSKVSNKGGKSPATAKRGGGRKAPASSGSNKSGGSS